MIIIKIVFWWLVIVFFYILIFKKEKPVKYKQIVRNKNGKKHYRIDYLKGKGLRWR